MPTQRETALQMIAQLRLLDPSVSAEIGTPERKILDTVAQAITDAQIDLNALAGALDFEAKAGASLDRFLALFGFARQRATYAQGFVTLTRNTASSVDITIPSDTLLMTSNLSGVDLTNVQFRVSFTVTLLAGQLSVVVPVQAVVAGVSGNVAANTITQFSGSPVLGITGVNNAIATAGGVDAESDDELKLRFKNTVFRNLAGTQDQYLALAAATAVTTKANVVGPISRYREYVQVPNVDDATSDGAYGSGNGNAGEYTSALSTIPYSKYTYDSVPNFLSNGKSGIDIVFYRPDVDFVLNTTPTTKNRGDTYRLAQATTAPSPLTDTTTTYQPNITLKNIYTGIDSTVVALRAKDVVLFEHAYLSDASRNDFLRGVTNAVDVFIDGGNNVTADTIVPIPSSLNTFVNNPFDKFHYDNYRRIGEAEHRPILGNVFTPLFWAPVIDLPNAITVNNVIYYKGIHYWTVQETSLLRGTVRARDGIEWSIDAKGQAAGDPAGGPYSGARITENPTTTSVSVAQYTYDKNIVDLQATLEGNKQVTTDVLAHKAALRYFKFDVTVMYTQNVSVTDTNDLIRAAVTSLLGGLFFGTVIQLSDVLQVIHNVPGVDNVRWSADVPNSPTTVRVQEVDIYGRPLTNIIVDRIVTGGGAANEIQQIYITGAPTGGTFQITQDATITPPLGLYTASIAYNASAATVGSALGAAAITGTVDPTTLGTPASPWRVTFGTSPQPLMGSVGALTGGPRIFSTDFFFKDNELPALPINTQSGDTLPGLIIRTRAQNTWIKS